ncbi:MAG TPA: SAM-dependent DNA methyltransferase, partial [bacterium]|nr:SAM-dependent DNA methyltransferase [bacterium]
MPSITSEQRRKLENTVIQAREVAEEGARIALESLAVHEAKPYDHMNEEQRRLRTHLRARGRQLGDALTGRALAHLISACAYEHWHRMLFACCLAENHLLLHPEMGVAITLEECEELAKEDSANKWQLASLLAQHMLPQIFRPDDPLLQVPLPLEFQLKLEQLLAGLDAEIFQANDAIGWVYQFWQTKRKQEVNESNDKVGADELPSVTQLFTEDYMVDFMLDNTLGAWWVARHPEGTGRQGAGQGTDALSFKYLRRKTDGSPMAGDFSQWPQAAAELKCLDPCCGSGHFLVALFERLVAMRMAEEELDKSAAAHAVLRDNLYGLEIDPRCTQLAAFNLALAAWKLAPAAVAQTLPELNIACCGLEIGVSLADWKALAPQHGYLMNELYKLFDNAVTYGSLIDPRQQVKTFHKDDLGAVTAMVERGLEAAGGHDYGAEELGVTAKGLTTAYRLLGDRYHLVATNVPYLARGKQDEVLRSFIETHYPAAKQDLATAFVERCRDFCLPGGAATLVTPQNWLFLGSYAKLREKLLKQVQWDWVARLGPRAFETISGEVVNVALLSLTNRLPEEAHELAGLDVSAGKNAADKAQRLLAEEVVCVSQAGQLGNPDGRIVLARKDADQYLVEYSNSYKGITSGDDPHFRRYYWEKDKIDKEWKFLQSTVDGVCFYGGCEYIQWYEAMLNPIQPGVYIRAWETLGKLGIMVSQMRQLPVALSLGETFDTNAGLILPIKKSHLPAIWCFCSSPEYNKEVRKIDQKLNVTNATLVKVPFDLERWQKVAAERYPDGLPEPCSNDPTQWLFHGHPFLRVAEP